MAASKPAFPWQLPLLGGISALGLYALFRAGEAAFSLLERGHTYSLTMALFIEAASVAVALEIALSYKETVVGGGDWQNSEPETIKREVNWPAVIVEIVTLLCSAIFNYTWVAKVLTNESFIQIAAYSVGPLVALSGIGMTTGNVLRKWLTAMDEWKLTMASQAQAEEAGVVAYQREVKEQARQDERDARALTTKLEAEERTRAAKVQERIQRKKLKLQAEASAWSQEHPIQDHRTIQEGPIGTPGTPSKPARKTWEYMQEHTGITQAKVAEAMGVTPRTIRKHVKELKDMGIIRNGNN